MILVKPSATIEMITPNALLHIERCGRTCYKSEEKIGCLDPDNGGCYDCVACEYHSSHKFTKMIIQRGHETVLEHASATVRFIVDRGVSHELVRHRIASFSQESTRYCDYEKGHVAFVIPSWCEDAEEGEYTAFRNEMTDKLEDEKAFLWYDAMLTAETSYKQLRTAGWKPEQARSVLPNSLKTEVVMTANFREWRHFFKLRTAKAAHPQMREVTIPLLEEFKKLVPVVFDDINS